MAKLPNKPKAFGLRAETSPPPGLAEGKASGEKLSGSVLAYNEEETIPELYRRVSDVMDSLDDLVLGIDQIL